MAGGLAISRCQEHTETHLFSTSGVKERGLGERDVEWGARRGGKGDGGGGGGNDMNTF